VLTNLRDSTLDGTFCREARQPMIAIVDDDESLKRLVRERIPVHGRSA
jgi:hypothetical protein